MIKESVAETSVCGDEVVAESDMLCIFHREVMVFAATDWMSLITNNVRCTNERCGHEEGD